MDNDYALLLLVKKQVNIHAFCSEFDIQDSFDEYTSRTYALGFPNQRYSFEPLTEFEFKFLLSFFDLRGMLIK